MKKVGAIGPKKKNPFQRHKNAESERRKKQEEEEARVLAEFEASFGAGAGDAAAAKPAPQAPGRSAPVAAPTPAVQPPRPQPSMWAASRAPPTGPATMDAAPKGGAPTGGAPTGGAPTAAKGGRKNLDMVLEKLKGEKAARLQRESVLPPAHSAHRTSSLDSDTHSTNLYVSNLYRTVTETVLMETFGRFGPLASVKIMWPRGDEEAAAKTHNSGFVAFMTRKDAEAAVANLNGAKLHNTELRIGFGKSVPIPAVPVFPRPHSMPRLPGMDRPALTGSRYASQSVSMDVQMHKGVGLDIVVTPPKEPRVRFIIDTLCRFILSDGTDLEQLILAAEHENVEFDFLRNVGSEEHMYYRWRLYSLSNGDSMGAWRMEPFVMVDASNRVVPPPLRPTETAQTTTAAQRGGERERDAPLSDLERERLEDMLRQLRVERADIREAMLFALDRAGSASEIVECLVSSLTLSETPLHLKVSRLYLLSDILHNSTVPVRNASRYRQLLQAELPLIFSSFHAALRSIDRVMTREAFKRCTLRVLRVWRDWYLFSEEVLNGLQAMFLMEPVLEWRKLFPDKVQEYETLKADELERKCKVLGVLHSDDRDASIDHLVAQHVFTVYGASGPPVDMMNEAGSVGATGGQGATLADSTQLGLLAAYDGASDSSGGSPADEDSPPPQLFQVQADVGEKEAKVSVKEEEAARQWTQIDEHDTVEKPMSQWLLERQVQIGGQPVPDSEADGVQYVQPHHPQQ